jgi:hypothetical protein
MTNLVVIRDDNLFFNRSMTFSSQQQRFRALAVRHFFLHHHFSMLSSETNHKEFVPLLNENHLRKVAGALFYCWASVSRMSACQQETRKKSGWGSTANSASHKVQDCED